jgi:cation diffusion facilitator family transporter
VRGERKTVLIALAANAVIAVAKGIGGIATGSSAMLAEAAHSVADTINQIFMLVSLRLGERPADEEHPFGHGKERFFWTFLACVLIFLAGAVFSIGDGILRMLSTHERAGSFAVNYTILGVAFVAEGISLVRAVRQTRAGAQQAGLGFAEYVKTSKEPTTKTVVAEDTVAVLGVVVAFIGIALQQVTGSRRFDAGAAIGIGLLLVYVAYALGRNVKGLLLGEAARPDQRERMRRAICRHDEIDDLLDLRTMYLGPHSLLVAARIDLADGVESERVEQLANEIEAELRDAVPDVTEVFLDPTPRS